MKKFASLLLSVALLLSFAGCGESKQQTVDIPVLSFNMLLVDGGRQYVPIKDWFDSGYYTFLGEFEFGDGFYCMGYADEDLKDDLIARMEERKFGYTGLDFTDYDVIDGKLYIPMNWEEGEAVSWYDATDGLPKLRKKIPVAAAYVQRVNFVSAYDGQTMERYYVKRAVYKDGQFSMPYTQPKQGKGFGVAAVGFDRKIYLDATNANGTKKFDIRDITEYEGREVISHYWVDDYDSKYMQNWFGDYCDEIAECIVHVQAEAVQDSELCIAYIDVELLKQAIIKERASRAA